jgi:short-subunit dehydrogenase
VYHYKTALITGASSGIGEAFAEAFAKQGLDLILVARSRDKLDATAAWLAKTYGGVRVEVIIADLSQSQPGAALAKKIAALGLSVDVLVNNAGFGLAANFHKNDPARQQQMIALNVSAVVDLAQTFLPAMLERGAGAIINIASLAGFQPTPYMTVYGATKAFVLSFSEGLWAEYRGKGIAVIAVCPGPVDTAFFEATGNSKLRQTVPPGTMLSAQQVVAHSLKALRQGKSFVVPGVVMKLTSLLPRFMPRALVANVAARTMKR